VLKMKFDEKQIAPPKDWQKFEDLCLAIFKRVWNDPYAQKNGRQGQSQAGTDVSGRPTFDPGSYHGVQCKGKDRFEGEVTEKELREEIDKALTFQPQLKHWILATSGKKDAEIEEIARVITAEHEKKGLFKVQVLGWGDLQALIAGQSAVIAEFYPEHTPPDYRLEIALSKLAEATKTPASISARKAAEEDLAAFHRQLGTKSAILLGLEIEKKDGRVPTTHLEIAKALLEGETIILEAEPGAGKSTTLVQIATSIANLAEAAVPIIVPLTELKTNERDIWSEAFARPKFSGIDATELDRLASEGAIIFLCDGWNELAEPQRVRIHKEFRKLKRTYEKCGLLIATRSLAPLLLAVAEHVVVSPLSRAQQLEILSRSIGDAAEGLLTRARRKPGLRSIIRIPLYLQALAAYGKGDQLPDTKEEILRNFVSSHDNHPDHRDALQAGLHHFHTRYLRDIAYSMVDIGTVSFSESEMRTAISKVSQILAKEGQFKAEAAPDPNSALEMLVAHHILIQVGRSDNGSLYGFQHQQFLEWYASFAVERLMIDVHSTPTDANLAELDRLLDRTDITETVQFAVERLSRRTTEGGAAGTTILRTLQIDPLAAAELINRVPDAVWDSIKGKISAAAVVLLTGGQRDRIIRFMGATGKPDFAQYIWPELVDRHKYDKHGNASGRSWLRPKSLGADALKRLSEAEFDLRRAILWDFVSFGGQEGIEFAIEAAKVEKEPKIVADIVRNLEFSASDDETDDLLKQLSADAWIAISETCRIAEFRGEYRAKIIELKSRRASKAEGLERYHLLRELAEAGEAVDGGELVQIVLASQFKDAHLEYSALEFLNEKFPELLKEGIGKRVANGERIPMYAERFAGPPAHALQLGVLERAMSGEMQRPFDIVATARSLDQSSVEAVLAAYCEMQNDVRGEATPERQTAYGRRSKLLNILNSARIEFVVKAAIARNVLTAGDVSDISEIIYRWQDEERDRNTLDLEGSLGNALLKAIEKWGEILLKDSQRSRDQASNLVSAVKRIAKQELFPLFTKLLNFELAESEVDRKYREEWRKTGKKPQPIRAMTGYAPIYRQALAGFEGDEVRDYLVCLLDDSTFGIDAAFELRRFGTKRELDKPENAFGHAKYDRMEEAKKARSSSNRPLNRVAAQVIQRIEKLLAAGAEADIVRACSFATAAVQMDFGDKLSIITAPLERLANPKTSYGQLEVMAMVGIPIDAKWVVRGYQDELKSYLAQKWHNQNDFWTLRRWIELLALSSDPAQIIDAVKSLPEELRRAHNFHEVTHALGYSTAPNATEALIDLANLLPELGTTHDFFTTLSRLDTERGTEYLLSYAVDPQSKKSGRYDHALFETLSRLLNRHKKPKAQFMANLMSSSGQSRQIYARLLSSVLHEEDVLKVLSNVSPEGDPIAEALVRGVADLAVQRIYSNDGRGYEQQPKDLKVVRAELLSIAAGDGGNSHIAHRILLAIEDMRERYGRPTTEPRHPNINSGLPWPLGKGTDARQVASVNHEALDKI
jgi:hypothetical protein